MPPKGKATAAKGKGGGRKPKAHALASQLPIGTVVRDFTKTEWKIGQPVGVGGFGLIYLADKSSSGAVSPNANYVIKVEPHQNGPLFCELHFYQRVAKPDLISEWMKGQKLKSLGMPKFIASGIHEDGKSEKYRFMVMERFGTDLHKLFLENGKRFPRKTVLTLGIRLLEVLEYVHSKEYCHADIKASNLLLPHNPTAAQANQVYLVDYGLAYRYVHDGKHKEYRPDPKWKHNGTIEFTSRDAHNGLTPSRRGDLEILGYCMLQWLCGELPWEDKLQDCVYVQNQKDKYMDDLPLLMRNCFTKGDKPDELEKLLKYTTELEYDDQPDYNHCKQLLRNGLKKLGLKDDGKLEFSSPAPGKTKVTKTSKRKSSEEDDEDIIEDSDDDLYTSPQRGRGRGKKTTAARVKSPLAAARVKSPLAASRVKSPAAASRVKSPPPVANGRSPPVKTGKAAAARGRAAAMAKSPLRAVNPAAATSTDSPATKPAAAKRGRKKQATPTPDSDDVIYPVTRPPPTTEQLKATSLTTKVHPLSTTVNGPPAAKKRKLIKSSVACQTSPGLKGLKRSRKSR